MATTTVVALAAQILAACGPASQPQATGATPQQPQTLPVSTVKVARDTIVTSANYGGSIQPKSQLTVLTRIAGRVTKLPVDVGAVVTAGQAIAELDHATIDAQVAQAQANLNSAQANLTSAQAKLATILAGARAEDVAVARAQLDSAKVKLAQVAAGARDEDIRSAQAGVASAQARLDSAQAGGRPEDIVAAQAQLDSAKVKLAQVQAAGRPEDIKSAESQLASAKAKLDQLQHPRAEDLASARAALDQAQTRLSQAMDAGTGTGITGRARPEDLDSLTLKVQRAQAALDKALADQAHPPASTTGSNTPQQLQLAVSQAQIDLQTAKDDLAKAQNAGPTDWDIRLLQESVASAKATYDKLVSPSPADIATAQAAVDQAQSSLDKLHNVTSFDIQAAQDSVNQSQANLDKLRNADPSAVAQAQAALDQANANLQKLQTPTQFDLDIAQASVDQAAATLSSKQNPFTDQDRQTAQAAVAQAQAAVDQQSAALQIQQVNLNEAFITAPFDGIVSDRAVTEGAAVGANAPILTLISKDVEIALNVEEQHVAHFQEKAPATFTVTAFPGELFKGLVTSVFPSGDTRSRTFTVKVKPEDQGGRLRAGMFAQLTVELERRENVPVIQKDAVVLRNDKPYAFVVANNQAALRQLDLGISDDKRFEVKNGVQPGDDLVVSGQATLRDKDTVRVVPAGGAQGGQRPAGQAPAGQQPGGQQGQGGQGQPAQQGQRGAGQGTPPAAGPSQQGNAGQGAQGGQQRPAGTPGARPQGGQAGQPGQGGQGSGG